MADHLTADEIDRLAQGDTTAVALERADAHLAACVDCRDRLAQAVSPGSDLLAAVRIEGRAHLTFDQLENGIKDEEALDPLARQHLAACDTCRRELDDLREFERLQPVAQAATEAALVANGADDTRAGAGWRLRMWSFACAAAALVVVAGSILRFVPFTAGPIQLTVHLANTQFAVPPPSTVGPNGETGLSNEVLLAIARARREAERTGQPQAIDVQIERRQYEGLLRQLRTEGVLDSATAGEIPGDPGGVVRVRLTLIPPG